METASWGFAWGKDFRSLAPDPTKGLFHNLWITVWKMWIFPQFFHDHSAENVSSLFLFPHLFPFYAVFSENQVIFDVFLSPFPSPFPHSACGNIFPLLVDFLLKFLVSPQPVCGEGPVPRLIFHIFFPIFLNSDIIFSFLSSLSTTRRLPPFLFPQLSTGNTGSFQPKRENVFFEKGLPGRRK